MNVLDLFSGIGGFSLGLERAGMRTVAFCEIDPYCRAVLRKHWPNVPIYGDIRELTAERLRTDGIAVDVICGGFPCQRFSSAARGRNNAPDLWPEMARVVGECLPQVVIAENVARRAIATAADYLVSIGMRCDVIKLSADDVGADHERVRWWVVAHSNQNSEFPRALDAEMAELSALVPGLWGPENYRRAVCLSDGFPPDLDGVRALGNAVMPIIPEIIGRAIMEYEVSRA